MRAKDRSTLSLKLKSFFPLFCLALAAHLIVRINGLPVGTSILFGANGEKKIGAWDQLEFISRVKGKWHTASLVQLSVACRRFGRMAADTL